MKALTKWTAGAALGAALLASAPASAQYYGDDYDRYRDRNRVEDVVRGIGTVVGVVAGVTQGGNYGYGQPGYGYNYGYGQPGYGSNYGYGNSYGRGRGFESHAVNACAYEAQRRFGGGRIEVRDVQHVRGDRLRVLGAVDAGGSYGGYNRYDGYNRNGYDGNNRNGYGRRAFSCDVGGSGRVTRFRTHNYGW